MPALDALSGAEHARILAELADEVMSEASKLGVVLSADIADQFLSDWFLGT